MSPTAGLRGAFAEAVSEAGPAAPAWASAAYPACPEDVAGAVAALVRRVRVVDTLPASENFEPPVELLDGFPLADPGAALVESGPVCDEKLDFLLIP